MRQLGRPPSDSTRKPTNERILVTAADLFLVKSYQEVSMDDVAEACNVTKATVYYYYKTKTRLYTEAMVGLMNRVRSKINYFLEEENSLYDQLVNIAEAYLHVATELDTERFMHSARNSLSDDQIKAIQKAEEAMYSGIEDAIREADEKGDIHTENPAFAVRAYIALVKIGLYHNADGESLFNDKENKAKQIVEFFWRSLEK
ncbi:TetR/AcrR family transcriptional regulator [Virgibacillus kekensis]|uniref:TetR/AcrR family transcriptional regulator n=1 Tax=Virgibacillus kekensis TaxID=202261 RepID=A0ABV9DI54_9BACI